WRRPRGRDQRPAGTSRDEPAGVRRPGPRRPRGPSRSNRELRTAARPDGEVGGDEGGRAPRGAPTAGDPDSRPSAEGGSGQLSPRNRREPNASAGGDRRSLGLFFFVSGSGALPSRPDDRGSGQTHGRGRGTSRSHRRRGDAALRRARVPRSPRGGHRPGGRG